MFLFRTNKKVNFYELSLSTASYLFEKSLTFVQANKKKKGGISNYGFCLDTAITVYSSFLTIFIVFKTLFLQFL